MLKYKRVLLKVSGESLSGKSGFGIDIEIVDSVANDIKQVREHGVEVAVVIGGGNIVRGVSFANSKQDRVSGDHMGMLATVINALALQNSLIRAGVPATVFSAITMPQICASFKQQKVLKAFEKGKVVIFAGGTGNPFFTTDTAAALRAAEIGADLLVKATQVDGVYDSDPKLNSSAKLLDRLSYDDVLKENLLVMDMTAFTLARDNKIPVLVYSIAEKGGFLKVLSGEGRFSIVS